MRVLDKCIYGLFVVIVVGSLAKIVTQIIGLICLSNKLVVLGETAFVWVYLLTAFTGIICWLYTYIKKKDS